MKALDFLRSPLFFRVWVVWGGAAVALVSLRFIYWLGWVAQPAYIALLAAFFMTTSRDVCSRCEFYGSWHCGGIGKAAASITPRLKDPIPAEPLLLHYILIGLVIGATMLGLFLGGVPYGVGGVVWLAVAAFSAVPAERPFSWLVGREQALVEAQARMKEKRARKLEEERRRAEEEERRKTQDLARRRAQQALAEAVEKGGGKEAPKPKGASKGGRERAAAEAPEPPKSGDEGGGEGGGEGGDLAAGIDLLDYIPEPGAAPSFPSEQDEKEEEQDPAVAELLQAIEDEEMLDDDTFDQPIEEPTGRPLSWTDAHRIPTAPVDPVEEEDDDEALKPRPTPAPRSAPAPSHTPAPLQVASPADQTIAVEAPSTPAPPAKAPAQTPGPLQVASPVAETMEVPNEAHDTVAMSKEDIDRS